MRVTISPAVSCFGAGLAMIACLPTAVRATIPTYGTYTIASARSCQNIAPTDPCSTFTQPALSFVEGGGPNIGSAASNTSLPNGSYALASGTFGGLGLPVLRGAVDAVGSDDRMGSTSFAYQNYTYLGPSGTPFSLQGNLHFASSSGSPSGGLLPDGVYYQAYIGIWDSAFVPSFSTGAGSFAALAFRDCTTPGVLGYVSLFGVLTGGTSIPFATTSCSANSLVLSSGQQVLTVANMQFFANRGGFADASDTFTVGLDPTLSADALSNLTNGLVSAISGVPEPSSWALMLLGFGVIGLGLRHKGRIRKASPA